MQLHKQIAYHPPRMAQMAPLAAASTCTLSNLLCPHYPSCTQTVCSAPLPCSVFSGHSFSTTSPRVSSFLPWRYEGVCGSLFSPSSHCPLEVWVPGQKGGAGPCLCSSSVGTGSTVSLESCWGFKPSISYFRY